MSLVPILTAKLTAPLTQVINSILTSPYSRLYNPENIFILKDGGGAGNNWVQGYASGERIYEEVMDMIERGRFLVHLGVSHFIRCLGVCRRTLHSWRNAFSPRLLHLGTIYYYDY